MTWSVREGDRVGDYQYPPRLWHSCAVCGAGYTDSQVGTAHKTVRAFHLPPCGQRPETCPLSVAMQYEGMFKAWKSRSKRPPVEKISAASPAHHVRAFGLKSKDELILEATVMTRSR